MIAVELIDEARAAGARLIPCCKSINISPETYNRWKNEGADLRPTIAKNYLSQ
ncbi:MAG: hypothetical protein ACRC6X_05255 [Culicoidibacterales bacterium]